MRIYKFAGNAAEAALSSHKSMTTDPGPNSDNFGVFRYRADATGSGSFDEQRLSLAFTNAFDSFIKKACSQDAVVSGAREQYDECKNSQDYVLNRRLSGGTLPLVVIEFANDKGTQKDYKEAQLFAYICNNAHLLPAEKSMLSIGVSFCYLTSNPVFQVFGYYQVDSVIIHVVPITPRLFATQDNLANLFYATLAFALFMTEESLPLKNPADGDLPFLNGYGGTVKLKTLQGIYVCKVMNYENFHPLRVSNGGRGRIHLDDRRRAEPAEKMLGSKTWLVGENISIVSYKFLPGDHSPSHTACVASCIGHLEQAHNGEKLLHCDLHLGNFVFNANNPTESRIIDWDHARNIESLGKYVNGWLELPERHPDAKAGANIEMKHERHSLSRVLRWFCPESNDDDKVVAWEDICRQAADCDLSLQVLQQCALELNFELKFASAVPSVADTGSLASIEDGLAAVEI